jgi:2'-5' RNA ligase
MPWTETALLVVVPEAEVVVGPFRARLDSSARWGVPPHITVLFPFVPPDAVDQPVLDRVAAAVAGLPAFDQTLTRLGWFDERVLWLAPEPGPAFQALTAAVWAAFPEHPPYQGEFADVVPHLTIGHDMPVDVLRGAADAIGPRLPIRSRVRTVSLLRGSSEPAAWHTIAEFPLA